MFKTFIYLIIFAFIVWILNNSGNKSIKIRIKNGLVIGKQEQFDGNDVNVFLGIPYAEPPVGNLRFRKPMPKTNWNDTIDANEWPNSCVHQKIHHDYFTDAMSEDCLYLNIWSPVSNGSADTLKPVLFFIHGGGLSWGSSAEKFYSGHVLAVKADIVVVTINYRLNIFGFLYSGTDDAPGNMGLWDQSLALEWVNDNIRYFGGDPSMITLAGESAGSAAVGLHILSPASRHLFRNAIVMSGPIYTKQLNCEKVNKILVDRQYAKSVGCSGDEDSDKNRLSQKTIECLKTIPTEQLIPGYSFKDDKCFSPTITDGEFLPYSHLEMIDKSDFKKNFNLLLGTTEDEGSIMLPMAFERPTYDMNEPPNIDYDRAINLLEAIVSSYHPEMGNEVKSISKYYFTGLTNDTDSDILRRTVGIALGDLFLGCPTILFGKRLYEKDPKMNVFQYYYNSKAGSEKLFCAKWMGVCHFDDIYPVFGIPFTDYDEYVDKEREVSEKMIEIFSSFVKTGRPAVPSASDWQQFYKIENKIIAPFYEITNEPKTGTNFGVDLKITECEYLWKKYLDP